MTRHVLAALALFAVFCAVTSRTGALVSEDGVSPDHGFEPEYIDRLEEQLTAGFEAFDRAPGLVVVVVQRGFEPHIVTLGDLTESHLLPIASITKNFTGLTAARLHLEGLIDLDADLSDAWPQLVLPQGVDLSGVQVRDLLTHSSGLSNPGMDHRFSFSGLTSSADLRASVEHTQNNTNAPAGSYSYSNFGYNLFAQYLEAAHQISWVEAVTLTAQMAGAESFTLSPSSIIDDNRPRAYYGAGQDGVLEMDYQREDYNTTAAGGGFLTARDMGHWLSIWLEPDATPQLTEAIEMASEIQFERNSGRAPVLFDGYGLGWFVGSFRGHAYLQHSGGFFGVSSYAAALIDDGFAVFAMTNEYPLSSALTGFAGRSALDLWLNDEEIELPTPASLEQTAEMGVSYYVNQADEIYGDFWSLSFDQTAFTGRFHHPSYGDLRIFLEDGELYAAIGVLCTPLLPGENHDTAAGDLIPFNHEAYTFGISEGRATSLSFRAGVFGRVADIANGSETACPR